MFEYILVKTKNDLWDVLRAKSHLWNRIQYVVMGKAYNRHVAGKQVWLDVKNIYPAHIIFNEMIRSFMDKVVDQLNLNDVWKNE